MPLSDPADTSPRKTDDSPTPRRGGAARRLPASTISDGELIARTRRGDPSAFDVLVRRYLKRAMAVAWEYVGSREDAEDVVQESFRRVLKNLDRFDLDRSFRPWFFTIVRNASLNLAERGSRWKLTAVPDSLPSGSRTPLDDVEASQLRAKLNLALGSLSEMQRRCFRLCALEGFTSAEAGEALGIKEETVRTHVFRARKALIVLMKTEDKEGWTA
jgi:RNA polymerase sigma-70 factor (ECF subfamily)